MVKDKRRQYGTGAVYQRASDGRWIGAIQAGWTSKGTARRITVSCAAELGEAECKRRLQAKIRQIDRDGVPTTSGRATVKTWAESWLAQQVHKVRPKTYATHRSSVNVWVIPTIGHKRLDTLTPADVRAVSEAIRKAGRSSSTALRCHVVLIQMLTDAVLDGYRVPQRVLMVDGPSKAVSDRDAIDLDQALKLLQVAAAQPDGSGSRWIAALLQGMRQGECLGLTWEMVNLDQAVMDVSWQLQALPYVEGRSGALRVPDGYEYRQLDGGLCLVRPKTEQGHRVIPLVPWMVTALTAWANAAPRSPHGLVWPRPDGRPQSARADTAAWAALQTTAGVTAGPRKYHLHEARHTTATLLLEAGTDPKVVTAIMGHSSIVTSRGYQHVSQTLARQALDGVADRLRLVAAPDPHAAAATDSPAPASRPRRLHGPATS